MYTKIGMNKKSKFESHFKTEKNSNALQFLNS